MQARRERGRGQTTRYQGKLKCVWEGGGTKGKQTSFRDDTEFKEEFKLLSDARRPIIYNLLYIL